MKEKQIKEVFDDLDELIDIDHPVNEVYGDYK